MRSVEHQNFFPFSIMEKSVTTTTTTNITISLVFQFLLLLQDFIFSLQQKKILIFYENTLNTD